MGGAGGAGALAIALLTVGSPARAQVQADAQLVAALTRVDPVPGAHPLTELRVVQPVVMVRANGAGGHLAFQGTVSVEGATMANGELSLAAWGEGFIDRRHPHTYAHELMLTAGARRGHLSGRISGGKGFVAFGTDDPMSRPPLRYPVNHHYSQILERAVAIAALGAGPVTLEGSLFNGDEPERPDQWPNVDRFGDSWAARATASGPAGLEGQVSRAHVASPEHRDGAGPAHEQWSASLRWDRPALHLAPYALLEWARTETSDGFFAFKSVLAEGTVRLGRHRVYGRFEQTDRPEEQRVSDFRTLRPPIDDSLLGITRWTIYTAGATLGVGTLADAVALAAVVEGSYGRVKEVAGGIFDPEGYYGRDTFLSLTVALRARVGFEGHRMGRYPLPERGHH